MRLYEDLLQWRKGDQHAPPRSALHDTKEDSSQLNDSQQHHPSTIDGAPRFLPALWEIYKRESKLLSQSPPPSKESKISPAAPFYLSKQNATIETPPLSTVRVGRTLSDFARLNDEENDDSSVYDIQENNHHPKSMQRRDSRLNSSVSFEQMVEHENDLKSVLNGEQSGSVRSLRLNYS